MCSLQYHIDKSWHEDNKSIYVKKKFFYHSSNDFKWAFHFHSTTYKLLNFLIKKIIDFWRDGSLFGDIAMEWCHNFSADYFLVSR